MTKATRSKVTLEDLTTMRPEGIEFDLSGRTVSVMVTAQKRPSRSDDPDGTAGMGVKLDWQVLADGYIVGYLQLRDAAVSAWLPDQLESGSPAPADSIDDGIMLLAAEKPKPQHKHKHHGH